MFYEKKNVCSQREKTTDQHLTSTDGKRETNIEAVQGKGARGVGSEHDTAKLKN